MPSFMILMILSLNGPIYDDLKQVTSSSAVAYGSHSSFAAVYGSPTISMLRNSYQHVEKQLVPRGGEPGDLPWSPNPVWARWGRPRRDLNLVVLLRYIFVILGKKALNN